MLGAENGNDGFRWTPALGVLREIIYLFLGGGFLYIFVSKTFSQKGFKARDVRMGLLFFRHYTNTVKYQV